MSKSMINNRFLEETVFAIADGYCVINLTKNYVPGVMYQVIDGRQYNLNEQLGLPEDSSLQSLVDAWALTIPKEGLSDFLKEFDRERLLKRFENGERHISFRYWTRTATFEPMLAEDHMALYRDAETGDVIAVNYVLDRTEHYRLEEKERALEKSNQEYIKLLEEEKKHTAIIEKLTQELRNELDWFSVSIPGGVKISNDDPTYSFKYVSEQFANMLGYNTPEELIEAGQGSILGLAHPEDIMRGLADALDQYTRSDHYATIYRIRCKDGTYKYIEDRGQKVLAPGILHSKAAHGCAQHKAAAAKKSEQHIVQGLPCRISLHKGQHHQQKACEQGAKPCREPLFGALFARRCAPCCRFTFSCCHVSLFPAFVVDTLFDFIIVPRREENGKPKCCFC